MDRKQQLLADLLGNSSGRVLNRAFNTPSQADVRKQDMLAQQLEANRSVMSQPYTPYIPEMDRPEQGLESPPIAPDDLIGTGVLKAVGIPLAAALGVTAIGSKAAGKNMTTLAQALKSQRGMFIGENAKTWDKAKAAEALKRIQSGESPELVWKETGIAVAPWDKALRGEIPDNASFYRGSKAAGSSYADSVYLHPDLYEAYPSLGLRHVKEGPGEGGSWGTHSVEIGQKNASSTAAHEFQHGIQEREGFAIGGSPGQMAAEWSKAKQDQDFYSTLDALARTAEQDFSGSVDKAAKALNEIGIDVTPEHVQTLMQIGTKKAGALSEEAQNSLKALGGAGKYGDPGMNLYKRLAGEAEARLTQARLPMTMADRLNQYPYDPAYFEKATGVKLGDLIVRR